MRGSMCECAALLYIYSIQETKTKKRKKRGGKKKATSLLIISVNTFKTFLRPL